MALSPAKYKNNEDSLALLHHNPLTSSYDAHMSTDISVPSINEDTTKLFEVETNEIEGINNDITSSRTHPMAVIQMLVLPMIYMTMITMKNLIIPGVNLAR